MNTQENMTENEQQNISASQTGQKAIEVLASKLDIADIVSDYMPLICKDGVWVGNCILCGKGNLTVYPTNQNWTCDHCTVEPRHLVGFLTTMFSDEIKNWGKSMLKAKI